MRIQFFKKISIHRGLATKGRAVYLTQFSPKINDSPQYQIQKKANFYFLFSGFAL